MYTDPGEERDVRRGAGGGRQPARLRQGLRVAKPSRLQRKKLMFLMILLKWENPIRVLYILISDPNSQIFPDTANLKRCGSVTHASDI